MGDSLHTTLYDIWMLPAHFCLKWKSAHHLFFPSPLWSPRCWVYWLCLGKIKQLLYNKDLSHVPPWWVTSAEERGASVPSCAAPVAWYHCGHHTLRVVVGSNTSKPQRASGSWLQPQAQMRLMESHMLHGSLSGKIVPDHQQLPNPTSTKLLFSWFWAIMG